KGLSLLLVHGGKAEFYVGAGKVPGPCIPVVAIPTTSGTGSEATSICVFSDNEKLIKAAIVSPFLMPRLALVDPFLTYNCPNSVTASAGIDALVHVIECYTSNKANSFSDALALKAMELINRSLRTVVKNGSNREARNYMAEAALLAGIAFGNSGVAAVHALSYALGSRFHIAHGVANGLLLSYVMKYNLPSNFTKYATIAQILDPRLDSIQFSSPQKKAEHGVEVVKKLTIDIGIPVHLKELGVPYDRLREIAVVAMDGSRLLENNPKRLGLEDILGILESAW
ncbi:MAG: iron-containing alcohol dehydrogenase, partial [Chloroflexi bacterium]|nr:iron-containing alcohol dehydrogenase [Chloroflexota bacterium]